MLFYWSAWPTPKLLHASTEDTWLFGPLGTVRMYTLELWIIEKELAGRRFAGE
jgi:hypothetical protein